MSDGLIETTSIISLKVAMIRITSHTDTYGRKPKPNLNHIDHIRVIYS